MVTAVPGVEKARDYSPLPAPGRAILRAVVLVVVLVVVVVVIVVVIVAVSLVVIAVGRRAR
jgi:hypothetical protein